MKGFTVKAKLGLVKSSLPLYLGTNGFMCLSMHASGQSKLIKFFSIRAWESNLSLLGGEPAPSLSAIATIT